MFESSLTGQLKALSNPTRFRMLQVIAEAGRMGTADIEAAFGDNDIPAMWFHIHSLQRSGLVVSRRDGIALRLEVDTSVIEGVINALHGLIVNKKGYEEIPRGYAAETVEVQSVPEAVRLPEATVL